MDPVAAHTIAIDFVDPTSSFLSASERTALAAFIDGFETGTCPECGGTSRRLTEPLEITPDELAAFRAGDDDVGSETPVGRKIYDALKNRHRGGCRTLKFAARACEAGLRMPAYQRRAVSIEVTLAEPKEETDA